MTLEQAFRDEWGRVVASLIGFLGDFDLAEEAAQEAFALAAERWPRDGPPETATTVRVEDGKTLTTDGPFVEIKEAIGGYLLFEADDLDAAIELAARIPAAGMGGAIEVRPIVEW